MNISIALEYFAAGSLGILLHMFLIKIPSFKEKARAANTAFTLAHYLKTDMIAIIGNFLTIVAIIFGFNELPADKYWFLKMPRWLFMFVGFTGSSIILAVFSVYNKRLLSLIDIKTNKADDVRPPVNETNKEGLKELNKPIDNE